MKTLILTALLALSALPAQAKVIRATDDDSVNLKMVIARHEIPRTGALVGNVTSVLRGSLHALSSYFVVVDNADGDCQDDFCVSRLRTFELVGEFVDPAEAVYSRKIDDNTYSIAIMAKKVVYLDNGEFEYPKVKILLRVKFNSDGVADVAEYEVVNR